MFEKFTDHSRRVIVLAQEEARLLKHNYIGVEHLLLGLLADGEGDGAQALESLNITLDAARREVRETLGEGREPQRGHIPFTPQAKNVLERALREALTLRSQSIGSAHLLLGLIYGEVPNDAARVIERLGASLTAVRERAADFSGQEAEPAPSPADAVPPARPRAVPGRGGGLSIILDALTTIDRRLSRIERHLGIPADPGDVAAPTAAHEPAPPAATDGPSETEDPADPDKPANSA